MNVLIADDDKTFLHLLEGELRSMGWRVTIASDAMQAVMFAVRSPQHAIVLDVQMPGGTGVEAIKKLKKSAKTKSIPIVIVSASSDPTIEATLRQLGAEGFFRKPVGVVALDATLRELCRGVSGESAAKTDARPGSATREETPPSSIDEGDRYD